jgi:nucleotide-binding universal stress UspA family protein
VPSLYDDNPAVLGALNPVNKINFQAEKDGPGILEAAGELAAASGVAFRTRTRKGDPAEEIVAEARGALYDLIVLGNRGLGGLKGILMGSVSSKVSHSAPCSVLVVR